MLGQEHNLPGVLRIMRDLAIDGLKYRVRITANGDGAHHVFRSQSIDSGKNMAPALFPPLHHLGARCPLSDLKFTIAKAVRFFPIAVQEVAKTRAHVSRQVLYENCD